MSMIHTRKLILSSVIASLSACGGGGAGSVASSATSNGIGGTGSSSTGTIDGFGSVYVNGIRYNTDKATILVDGEQVSEDSLGLGMVVLVTGEVDDDGENGVAERIEFDDEVEGPVQSVERNADGDSMLITVLGVEVIAERTSTVFEHSDFDSLAVNDVIEVSGFPNSAGQIRATRIEGREDFQPGVTPIEVEGTVSDLNGDSFTLAGISVNFAGADLSEVSGQQLAEGMLVEVYGTLEDGVIFATRIEEESGVQDSLDEGDDFTASGIVSDYVSPSDFKVGDVPVNAANATFQPADLVLANGVIVEVEGTWNGSLLNADSVEARRGRIEIEAHVASIDADRVTLQLADGTVQVSIGSRTLLDDDTDDEDKLGTGDIRPGDFLEVEALQEGSSLVATRIDRDDSDDDVVQAPVDSFVAGDSITLLGLTYSTLGAEFEDANHGDLTAEQFYAALQAGMLVKVTDEQPADGIADEVEFESATELDGEREFGDDDFEDEHEDEEEDESEHEDEEDEEEEHEEEEHEEEEHEEEDHEEEEDEEEEHEEEEHEEEEPQEPEEPQA